MKVPNHVRTFAFVPSSKPLTKHTRSLTPSSEDSFLVWSKVKATPRPGRWHSSTWIKTLGGSVIFVGFEASGRFLVMIFMRDSPPCPGPSGLGKGSSCTGAEGLQFCAGRRRSPRPAARRSWSNPCTLKIQQQPWGNLPCPTLMITSAGVPVERTRGS